MEPRRLAICVEAWWSEENHYAWSYMKKKLFQGNKDHLIIIHVKQKTKDITRRWDGGTALLDDLNSVMKNYNHKIIEREGDSVSCILSVCEEESIDILVLGSSGQNRVKRTISRNTSTQVMQKAPCTTVIVSSKFSAGDYFRIQAQRQRDTLGSNVLREFKRRVAIVLNSGLWDSSLVNYAANNVVHPRDQVFLVRCLTKLPDRKNAEQERAERDSVRDIGWDKFRDANVSMAVELAKSNIRMICSLIESKGIDLVITLRLEQGFIPKVKDSMQSLHYRCPCPVMVIPTQCLEPIITSSVRRSQSSEWHLNNFSFVAPFQNGFSKLAKTGNLIKKNTFACPNFIKLTGRQHRRKSMEESHHDWNFVQVIDDQEEGIELEAIEEVNKDDSRDLLHKEDGRGEGEWISPTKLEVSIDYERDTVVNTLQQQLSEKEKEIITLKEQISILKSSS